MLSLCSAPKVQMQHTRKPRKGVCSQVESEMILRVCMQSMDPALNQQLM
jgi:hypothetical protein